MKRLSRYYSPVRNYQLTLVYKTLNRADIIIMMIIIIMIIIIIIEQQLECRNRPKNCMYISNKN